jgi:hypothetical protein
MVVGVSGISAQQIPEQLEQALSVRAVQRWKERES